MQLSIIKFRGGLGNQMFAYAFYMAQYRRSIFVFKDLRDAYIMPNGYELNRIFGLQHEWHSRMENKLCSLLIKQVDWCHIVEGEQSKIATVKEKRTLYDGFWQNEKYFLSVKNEVLKRFTFNTQKLSESTESFLSNILTKETIAVHIRRGDYLEPNNKYLFDVCGLDYYQRAMMKMKEMIPNAEYIFFSDDPDWVRTNIDEKGSIVDWNTGKDAWQDMFLMSKCKHNIIANSSFSWWGAYLNANPNKKVICPTMWLSNKSSDEYVPNAWIKL